MEKAVPKRTRYDYVTMSPSVANVTALSVNFGFAHAKLTSSHKAQMFTLGLGVRLWILAISILRHEFFNALGLLIFICFANHRRPQNGM